MFFKKAAAILLAAAMTVSLAACGEKNTPQEETEKELQSSEGQGNDAVRKSFFFI